MEQWVGGEGWWVCECICCVGGAGLNERWGYNREAEWGETVVRVKRTINRLTAAPSLSRKFQPRFAGVRRFADYDNGLVEGRRKTERDERRRFRRSGSSTQQ